MAGKKDLTREHAVELINEVRTSDSELARAAVHSGVKKAQDHWIEAQLIAEALTFELVKIVALTQTNAEVAAQLIDLAERLKSQPDVH